MDRQVEAAKAYCDRNGLILDERTFSDLGVSGYTGSNLAGELGVFLDLVRDSRIPKGSTLIVENMDRLSRLPPREANEIIRSLIAAGLDIVTTKPEQVYTAANIDEMGTWLPLQVAQVLAHESSKRKSDLVGDAWRRNRAKIAGGQKRITSKCPFWLAPAPDGKSWVVKETEADLMRKVFAWCIEGHGAAVICGKLHDIRPGGITGKGWQPNNLRKLMRNRQVLGEYQARTGKTARKGAKATLAPAGQPVRDYFPAIISEADFAKVQTLLDSRTHGGGRTTGTPNLFNGLLVDAGTGQPMVLTMGRTHRRMLVTRAALRKAGAVPFCSVPYAVFEAAVLSRLEELTPADVTAAVPSADAVADWSARLTDINHRIAKASERAARSDDPDLYNDQLEILGKDRRAIVEGLEAAKRQAACPASDTLGETQSLAKLLANAPADERDDLRRRLQAALRRLVKRMYAYVRFDPKNRKDARTALVRIQFAHGNRHRDYCFSWGVGGQGPVLHYSEARQDGPRGTEGNKLNRAVSDMLDDLIAKCQPGGRPR